MKVLINKTTKVAHFTWDDAVPVELKSDLVAVGDPVFLNIQFLNSTTGEIIENVPQKNDFWGSKYKYIDGQWVNNHPTDDGVTYTWENNEWTWAGRNDAENPVEPSEQWKTWLKNNG